MRIPAFSAALLAATVSLLTLAGVAGASAAHHPKTMTVTLDNGDTATFHIAKVGGKMMAMMSYEDFMAAFHNYVGGPHPK